MELTTPLPELLDALFSAIAAQQLIQANATLHTAPPVAPAGATPPPPTSVTVRIQTLAVFTHGWETSMKVAVQDKKAADLGTRGSKSYDSFVKGVAKHLSLTPEVVLYACRTAGLKNEETLAAVDVPIAAGLAIDLTDKIVEREDFASTTEKRPAHEVAVIVWGHEDKGSTTSNTHLVRLSGLSTSKEPRIQFLDAVGELALKDALRKAGVTNDLRNDKELRREIKRITSGVRHQMNKIFRVSNSERAPKSPMNVFAREMPFMGIDRVHGGLAADEAPTAESFKALELSQDARKRLADGFACFRPSYRHQIAMWQKQIEKAMSKIAKKPK